jgi:hypothetical protein
MRYALAFDRPALGRRRSNYRCLKLEGFQFVVPAKRDGRQAELRETIMIEALRGTKEVILAVSIVRITAAIKSALNVSGYFQHMFEMADLMNVDGPLAASSPSRS